jgi:probable rRNA maturation factor
VSVEVANEAGIEVDEAGLSALAQFVLDRMGIHPLAELSILLVDTAAMAELHEKWMDEPGPTDVLAFPLDELRPPREDDSEPEPGLLGDVVLCPEVAASQARAAGHSVVDELNLLCVHGILHLLGYDHAEPADEREMFGLQGRIVVAWQEQQAAGRTSAGGGPA